MTGALPVSPLEELCVRGLAGEREALAELLSGEREAAVLHHRLGPALTLRGRALGAAGAERDRWGRELRATAGRRMLLTHHLGVLGELLGAVGVPWLPLKGFDLGTRAYRRPEDRPASDLDILVETERLRDARATLSGAGWRSRGSGPRYESFLRDEAYCWQARHADGSELEVHFRLWGMVPEGYPRAILDGARSDPGLGATARRSHPADAYVLAAVHTWMDPPPRPFLGWWDLERIAGLEKGKELVLGVIDRGRRWGLQLPIFLAAGHAASLWPESSHGEIATALKGELRAAERRLVGKARLRGTDHLSLGSVTLARLLSRRPSRSGWAAVRRRVWPHPGVIERGTPESWPWLARRWGYLAHQQGWSGLSRWLDSRFAATGRPDGT